jgi:hypothetical protein
VYMYIYTSHGHHIHIYIVILTVSPSHVVPLFVTSCPLSFPSIKGGLGVLGSRIVW